MSVELKIKAKSLGAEAKMIRDEEQKLKRQARWHREKQDGSKAETIMRKHRSLTSIAHGMSVAKLAPRILHGHISLECRIALLSAALTSQFLGIFLVELKS